MAGVSFKVPAPAAAVAGGGVERGPGIVPPFRAPPPPVANFKPLDDFDLQRIFVHVSP